MSFELLPRSAQNFDHVTSRPEMPSLTYRLDLDNMRVQGTVNRQDAMRQAIFKHLQTWLRSHDIYDDSFGLEAHDLIGRDEPYVKSQLKRRIRDALRADTRILSVKNFRFSRGDADDALCAHFQVTTRFGNFACDQTIRLG